MKKFFLFLSIGMSTVILLSSCAHKSYNTRSFEYYYDLRMNKPNELQTKAQIKVFTAEKDVNGEYDVIAINGYTPVVFPLFGSVQKALTKKFYEQAVKKAEEMGGNAILVVSPGTYKVLSVTSWDNDSVGAAQPVSVIFDNFLLSRFTSGVVANSKKSAVKRYVASFCEEIENNLKTVRTTEEISIIQKKIAALSAHKDLQKTSNVKLSKFLEKANKKLQRISRKIHNKAKK